MRFFFDRCFAKPLCAAVKALEAQTHLIEHHDAHFIETTTDVTWLKVVGSWEQRPIIVSGDIAIFKKPDEIRELQSQNLTFILLSSGWMNLKFEETVWKFFKAWPSIVYEACRVRDPTVFTVSCSTGKIEMLSLTKNLVKKK